MAEGKVQTIDVRKLKESLDLLLGNLIDSGIECLDLDSQYYWEVEEVQKYGFQAEPKGYVVGDFSDDLMTLDKVLKNKDLAVAYTLAQVAPLVAYVGLMAGRKLAGNGN